MAENSTPSSSSPKPLQQNTPIIEPSNSQQLQTLTSSSPSIDQNQQQLVQSQQQLTHQQQMGQAQQQMQQQQLQQLQQQLQNNSSNVNVNGNSNNFAGISNLQALQRNASVSRLNQLQQSSTINNQMGLLRQQNSGIYGHMNFGNMNAIQQSQQNNMNAIQQSQQNSMNAIQQSQQNSNSNIIGNNNNGNQQQQIGQQNQLQNQQIGQQNQLQQQMGQLGGVNMSRSALIGQTGHLPMLSGQAAAQFNMQNQFLSSPRQKGGFMQGSQFQLGNTPGQSIPGMQAMGMNGSVNLSSQLRPNATLAYNQQRMASAQLRQQMSQQQQSGLTPSQGQNITRTSFMNGQMSGLAQNGQPGMMQNGLSQQQWLNLKQMSGMSSPNSSALRLQQRNLLMQQQLAASQLHQNSVAPNTQQLSPTVQQQLQIQKQQPPQQLLNQQRVTGSGGQKHSSLAGSQTDIVVSSDTATPGGSSRQGTEASNQFLGKRKIKDIMSQMGVNVELDPELEDFLLECADNFVDTLTKGSCTLAKHRKSSTLEVKDVLLNLEKNWKLTVPGYSAENKKHKADYQPVDAHEKRLDIVHTIKESAQAEPNSTGKQMVRQEPSDPMGRNQMMRQSPSSEQLASQSVVRSQMMRQSTSSDQLVSQSVMPQMMQQSTRF